MKPCSRCHLAKPLSEFYARSARCKGCHNAKRPRRPRPVYSIEKARARSRRWYKRNRQRHAAAVAAYVASNPERRREWTRRRRARLRAATVEAVDYARVRERDRDTCYLCGEVVEENALDFDHVIPLSRGGSHSVQNVAVTHASCNRSKGASTPHEYLTRRVEAA